MKEFELKSELKELLDSGVSSISIIRNKKYTAIKGALTSFGELLNLSGEVTIDRIIWHVFNEDKSCKTCGKPTNWRQRKKDYQTFCSSKCSMSDPEVYAKYKASIKENHGTEYIFQSEEVKEKRKNTLNEKYGVDSPNQNKEIAKKMVSTTKDTLNEKYGDHVTNVSQLDEVKVKRHETFKSKYEGGHPLRDETVRSKIKETTLSRHGVENIFQSPNVIKKRDETKRLATYEYMKKCIDGKYEMLFTEDEFTTRIGTSYKFKCLECSNEFEHTFNHATNIPRCLKCLPKRQTKAELDILKLVSDSVSNCTHNDRTLIAPYEIDILTPSFGIEYNGIYWHSYDNISIENKKRHLDKTLLCEERGIQLFHIFEDEWENKQHIWKSILAHKMNKCKKLYARKCHIKELDSQTKKLFLNENHLQGDDKSSIKLGLYYNEELVAVATFGKSRFDKKHQWELYRFCNKLNTTIVGGFSKLLKHFERKYKPSTLITYADRRYSQGNLYEKNGFEFTHCTDPNYYYVKNGQRFNRMKFQKHKLKTQLEVFSDEDSEATNMLNNGYRRLWDCGNLVFVKSY